MANPTTNFGWQMPTNSDLVTDLPADFEVFGQAVDTSLADLKGGTTGQILSKTTNADMDFTWVSPTTGDITGVSVTSPITGGGTSGDVTIGIDSTAIVPSQTGNSGKFLTTNGTASSWATVSSGWTLISTTSLSGSSTSISSIPSTYTNLMLIVEDYYPSANANFGYRINSDTTTNRSFCYWGINNNTGTPVDDGSYGTGTIYLNDNPTYNSDHNNSAYFLFPNYTATDSKFVDVWHFYNDNNYWYQLHNTARFDPTSAISSIQLILSTGTFSQGSARLYGI